MPMSNGFMQNPMMSGQQSFQRQQGPMMGMQNQMNNGGPMSMNNMMGGTGGGQYRPPPGKFWPNNVADFRVKPELEGGQEIPVTCDENVVMLHMAYTESAMDDNFVENVKRGKLFPIWCRSSGNKNEDHAKAKALGEALSMQIPNVCWEQLVSTPNKKEWRVRPLAAYSEDFDKLLVRKTLHFDMTGNDVGKPEEFLGSTAAASQSSGSAQGLPGNVLSALNQLIVSQQETQAELRSQKAEMVNLKNIRRAKTPDLPIHRPLSKTVLESGNPSEKKRTKSGEKVADGESAVNTPVDGGAEDKMDDDV